MKKIYLVVLLSGLLSVSAAQVRTKKVVFVIADGISVGMLKEEPMPNMDRISNRGALMNAYVGGEKGGYSQTPTISAVGYNSLLTGTWVNKHNVWDNDIADPNYHYPTIFRLFKDQYPQKTIGIFSSWQDNRTKLVGDGLEATGKIHVDVKADGFELDTVNYSHDKNRDFMHQIDERVIAEAEKSIRGNAPDLSWIYLEYTDDMGHKYGRSPQMSKALQYLDNQMGRIYDVLIEREKKFNEDWFLIITTDHGRDAKTGRNHGGQSDSERNTWIVMNKKPNAYGQSQQVGIVDIMPSIARFLDIKIPEKFAREIDGVPFFGNVSLAKSKVDAVNDKLVARWTAINGVGNVKIYVSPTNNFKIGGSDSYKLLATIPVAKGQFELPADYKPTKFYKLLLEMNSYTANCWYKP